MGVLDGFKMFLAEHQVPMRSLSRYPDIERQARSVWLRGGGEYKVPSVAQALGVPAILRCVTLISTSAGQLTVGAWRKGAQMEDTPRLVARPDPDRTPRGFWQPSTWNMATYGETVWYIASRDADGLASALVVVPLQELTVEENPRNRRRPRYTWGRPDDNPIVSTRWTPTNTDGRFVHVFLTEEPGALRGRGPLQWAGAAASVSVEAQQWAARFYNRGGYPSINLHHEHELGDEEARAARYQWMSTPQNEPQVTSGPWSVREVGLNPQGAQMLDSRRHQDGEAARMFGMPGTLLEYNSPGSSLTYQNIGEIFSFFVKSCLHPYYLEAQEQALSDLLPRTTVARFMTDAFYRPDMKGRWEVYDIAARVLGAEEAAQWAREREGLAPGDVEYKPVPFSPPAAVPLSREVRCDGTRVLQGRMVECGKLLTKTAGQMPDRCPRCKKVFAAA